jgi:hypothetical protein
MNGCIEGLSDGIMDGADDSAGVGVLETVLDPEMA